MSPRSIRCAIYTRKSTEEGLDQAFNSLDAQREACHAYVQSQAGEGWMALPTPYDDGGFSGGTMERPGLQNLLTDVDNGRVDVVVVYKIDRLTRSLADFAKIVERLEKRNASFVSVTQAFNTTTSMGRLTLNVLLSFAQFEREITAERILLKVPVRLRLRGGIKRVEGWDQSQWVAPLARHDPALIKALVSAHEWRDLIESGRVVTLEELAAFAQQDRGQVRRTLRLAFMAPDIQKAIVTGRQPKALTLRAVSDMEISPLWSEPRVSIGTAAVTVAPE